MSPELAAVLIMWILGMYQSYLVMNLKTEKSWYTALAIALWFGLIFLLLVDAIITEKYNDET